MTVPVPLTDNESHTIDVGPVYCPSCKREFGNTEAEALREALRIAVEGLDRVERWYVCANAPDDGSDFDTCRGCTDDPGEWCGWCAALDAIESVRELVDLGEKP